VIRIALATRADDQGIRHLLARNPMPGRIRVRFEREPSYFDGCLPGDDVLVARDAEAVVGVACRTIRPLYINGEVEEIGYLGQLRVDRSYRGRLLTARGYRAMRELHERRPARGYYTTIVEGNVQAEGVLVQRSRGGMPRYRFVEKLVTCAVKNVGRASAPLPRGGRAEARPTFGNLFPAYAPQGEVVTVAGGTAAIVDQRAYKQTVVDGYDRALSLVRPLLRLPKPGATLNHAYVTHFQAEDQHALIGAILEKAKGFDHVLFGFTEGDPALEAVRRYKPVEYRSSIYTVAFDDGDDFHERLLARPRALDISAL
jgi:predicted N-acetyltransferase YhbS